jgi:hypothetical protein
VLRLARILPEEQLSPDTKEAVKLAMGLIATMTAVLLGLLITSAKGTYDTAESEVMHALAAGFLEPSAQCLQIHSRKRHDFCAGVQS